MEPHGVRAPLVTKRLSVGWPSTATGNLAAPWSSSRPTKQGAHTRLWLLAVEARKCGGRARRQQRAGGPPRSRLGDWPGRRRRELGPRARFSSTGVSPARLREAVRESGACRAPAGTQVRLAPGL